MSEIQQDNGGEIQEDSVVISIDEKLTNLRRASADHCIYRVHKALRRLKPQAYTPQVVSIGPFHRGNKSLKAMEEHKLRYLQIFLDRFTVTLKTCVKAVRKMKERARKCYKDKTSNLSEDEFVNMLVVDTTFIISFLLEAEKMFDDYKYLQVKNDIILLENQLPFFVIERVFNKFVSHQVDGSLLELTFNLFKDKNLKLPASPKCRHFTDFLRICLVPLPPSCLFCPMPSQNTQDDGSFNSIPNAQKLHDAGVEFKPSPSECLVDIQFNARTGELQIPCITLEDSTESFFRNVMAFEMYHPGIPNTHVTNCMKFLDDLINTPNDVDLLVDKKIINNWLGDNQAVATLFNDLLKQIVVDQDNHFGELCKLLNAHYQFPINRWKATLNRDYFSTPWKTAATIAAVILLLLTLLSTIWTIIK